jgi:sec-independent protein translocase protein TatC
VVLVEIAEVIVWANDRRRARLPDPYADLADDDLAPLEMDDDPGAARSDRSLS